jgi:hypothetical protein
MMDFITYHFSEMEPSDFRGLQFRNNDNRSQLCMPEALPHKVPTPEQLKEWDNNIPKNEGWIFPNGGIFFCDEINRAQEDMRQSMNNFLGNGCIGPWTKPTTYKTVAAMNPPESDSDGVVYEVYDLCTAVMNKAALIFVQPTPDETLEYLGKKYAGSKVISWLMGNKDLIEYDGGAAHDDNRVFSPRQVENFIIIDNANLKEREDFKRMSLETVARPEIVQSYLSFLEELKYLTLKDVLEGKKQDKLQQVKDEGRLDILSSLSMDLGNYLENQKKALPEKTAKNIVDFLVTTPTELNMYVINGLSTNYFSATHSIVKNKYFMEKVVKNKLNAFGPYLKGK